MAASSINSRSESSSTFSMLRKLVSSHIKANFTLNLTVFLFWWIHLCENRENWTRYCTSQSALWRTLMPSDAKGRHRSGSTLAPVALFCPTAQSHCLNQCWHLSNVVLWHSHQSNLTASTQIAILHIWFKKYPQFFKLLSHLLVANE